MWLTRRAAASYTFSRPKALDFNARGDVIDLQFSYRPEFRKRQSSFQFLDRYDEQIFDAVFSFSQEFEHQIEASGPAESRSGTIVFFANKENSGKISKGLLGERDSNAIPFPRPLLLLGDTSYESGNCVQIICAMQGVHPTSFGPT
jgi:hypothetical protein